MSDNFRTARSDKSAVDTDGTESEQKTQIEETPFKPPEHVAKEEPNIIEEDINLESNKLDDKIDKAKNKRFRLPQLTRKQWLLIGGGLLILVAAFLTYWIGFRQTVESEPEPQRTVYTPPPTTGPSPLTGVEVDLELLKLPVTGIMIENSPDSRPQAGLVDAGVVFEAIAEGGITRFLALYQEAQPDYIGPVRSARPYYVDWVAGFDASYAHVGGSPDGIAAIKTLGVKDLDQFSNPGAFQRVGNRYAPHNVYTSRAALREAETARGYGSSNFTGFSRKKEEPVTTAPPARVVDLNISGFQYNVHYDYDQASNSYKRSTAGRPHVDERSGTQIAPKNVVLLIMTYSIAGNRIHSIYGSVGSGTAVFFFDGARYEGTWEKPDSKAALTLKDSSGQVMNLNPGQTWVTALRNIGEITSAP